MLFARQLCPISPSCRLRLACDRGASTAERAAAPESPPMGGERRKFLLERLGVVLQRLERILGPAELESEPRHGLRLLQLLAPSWILDAADIPRGRGANLERMVFEDQSRNTFENVRYSKNVSQA